MCFGKKSTHIQLPPEPPPLTLRDRRWTPAHSVPGQGYNLGPRPSIAHQRASAAYHRGSIAAPRGSIAGPAARRASVNPRLGNGAAYTPGTGFKGGRRQSNALVPVAEPEPAELPPQSSVYDSYDQRRWSTVPSKDTLPNPYYDQNMPTAPMDEEMNRVVPPEGRRDNLVIYGSDKRRKASVANILKGPSSSEKRRDSTLLVNGERRRKPSIAAGAGGLPSPPASPALSGSPQRPQRRGSTFVAGPSAPPPQSFSRHGPGSGYQGYQTSNGSYQRLGSNLSPQNVRYQSPNSPTKSTFTQNGDDYSVQPSPKPPPQAALPTTSRTTGRRGTGFVGAGSSLPTPPSSPNNQPFKPPPRTGGRYQPMLETICAESEESPTPGMDYGNHGGYFTIKEEDEE